MDIGTLAEGYISIKVTWNSHLTFLGGFLAPMLECNILLQLMIIFLTSLGDLEEFTCGYEGPHDLPLKLIPFGMMPDFNFQYR